MKTAFEPEFTLRTNKKNILNRHRSLCDLDETFVRRFFNAHDVFDIVGAEHAEDQQEQYLRILDEHPDLFIKNSDVEMERTNQRVYTHQALVHYLKKASEIEPLGNVLTHYFKFFRLAYPLSVFRFDCSVKLIVSLALAYRTIDNLGTEIHDQWKHRLETLEDASCFSLTELGHGSNVRQIGTTAHYDHENREFIINTPCKEAMKFWIGGAGKTSNQTVCFAQLYVNGKHEGIHAFIVPLRDKQQHLPLPGITIGDCGRKLAIDGVDNGFILFDHVRIPKENMLNRLSDIDENGVFHSHIKSADQRFALSLNGLSTGRILISTDMNFLLKRSLKIALRFSIMRQQFGSPKKDGENSLIDFQLQQYRLFPYIAKTFSYTNVLNFVNHLWDKNQKKIFQPGNQKLAEMHAIMSVVKPVVTWKAFEGTSECRKACGGFGYSYYSKFAELLTYSDVNQTWEGDNTVLMQQAGKYVLDQYKQKLKGGDSKTVTCQWIVLDDLSSMKCSAKTGAELVTPASLQKIFEFRCNYLLQKVASTLGSRMLSQEEDSFDVWNSEQVLGGVQDLAKAYGENTMLLFDLRFLEKMDGQTSSALFSLKPDTVSLFHLMFKMSALAHINEDLGTWFMGGYFTPEQGEMVKKEYKKCLEEMKRFAARVADILPPKDKYLDSMLAPADGDLYGSIVNRLYSLPGTFQRYKNWHELVSPSVSVAKM